jgi:hypothetical protein
VGEAAVPGTLSIPLIATDRGLNVYQMGRRIVRNNFIFSEIFSFRALLNFEIVPLTDGDSE